MLNAAGGQGDGWCDGRGGVCDWGRLGPQAWRGLQQNCACDDRAQRGTWPRNHHRSIRKYKCHPAHCACSVLITQLLIDDQIRRLASYKRRSSCAHQLAEPPIIRVLVGGFIFDQTHRWVLCTWVGYLLNELWNITKANVGVEYIPLFEIRIWAVRRWLCIHVG
jgi:hypothetical protein